MISIKKLIYPYSQKTALRVFSRPDLKDVREDEATTESGREFQMGIQRIEKNLLRASVYAN